MLLPNVPCDAATLPAPNHFVSCTHRIEDDSDDQAATGTTSDVLCLFELASRDLEAIATGARVVEEVPIFIVGHVLQLDLVVEGDSTHSAARKGDAVRKESSR